MKSADSVAVVIPCFRVASSIVEVVQTIPSFVSYIVVVDDGCPEQSGKIVEAQVEDPRVRVIYNEVNLGVGGAMVEGYKAVLSGTDAEIIVKVDGDGQMNPLDLERIINPIKLHDADYTKGNRFDSLEDLEQMPRVRILGNAFLSLMSKISSGYWNITDPTNGYTAIHRSVLRRVALDKVRKDFFFENDMLFRLSLVKAVVIDVPILATYGSEVSNLRIGNVIRVFPYRFIVNHFKRIAYNYYLREWNAASLELPVGVLALTFGIVFGSVSWFSAAVQGVPATSGQGLLAAVPIILGVQLMLSFLNFDVSSVPTRPRQLDS